MEPLLTVNEVAKLLRVSPVTVRRRVREGYFTDYGLGRAIKLNAHEVRQAIGQDDEPDAA